MLQSSLGTDHGAWRQVDLAEAVRQGMGCLRSRRQGSGRHDPALAVASWAGRSQSANSGHSTRGWDSRGHMAVTLVRAAVPLPRLVVEAAPPSTRRHLRLSDFWESTMSSESAPAERKARSGISPRARMLTEAKWVYVRESALTGAPGRAWWGEKRA